MRGSGGHFCNVTTEVTPTFDAIGPICQNATAPALPGTSIEGITGTWTPAAIQLLPLDLLLIHSLLTAGQCATTATLTITIITPEFTITKTATEENYSSPGNVIHYTITVTNTSIITENDILVTDPLTGLSQSIASLAPGASETILTSYTVTQADINAGSVNNTATASYTCGGITYTETASESIPALQRPELTITKTVDQTAIAEPTTLNYSIVVENTGNTSLTRVVLTDAIVGGATLSTRSPAATPTATTSSMSVKHGHTPLLMP